MSPVQKALWYVESHFLSPVSLDDVAGTSGVSAYHLTRAFASATGLSLMRYVRARRLTEAAKQLSSGAGDILRVALDAGYNSHESFTRAFKNHFGVTPEEARARGSSHHLPYTEAITLSTTPATELAPPRVETLPAKVMVGIVERHETGSPGGIPNQWQRFGPHLGTVAGQLGDASYGVCFNFDEEAKFDYLCGVEVSGTAGTPAGLVRLDIPAQRYAVFAHTGHIAGISATMSSIWNKALPESGHKPTNGPMLERYGPEFDPTTGLGGLEVWVPVENR